MLVIMLVKLLIKLEYIYDFLFLRGELHIELILREEIEGMGFKVVCLGLGDYEWGWAFWGELELI